MFPRGKHTQFAENNICESALEKAYETQWIASYEEFRGYFPTKFTMEVRKQACETTQVQTGNKWNSIILTLMLGCSQFCNTQ